MLAPLRLQPSPAPSEEGWREELWRQAQVDGAQVLGSEEQAADGYVTITRGDGANGAGGHDKGANG